MRSTNKEPYQSSFDNSWYISKTYPNLNLWFSYLWSIPTASQYSMTRIDLLRVRISNFKIEFHYLITLLPSQLKLCYMPNTRIQPFFKNMMVMIVRHKSRSVHACLWMHASYSTSWYLKGNIIWFNLTIKCTHH